MAEGFEPYHVPQQSRRDKLRVVPNNHPPGCAPLAPLYDLPPDFANLHRQSYNLPGVKEEGVNLMGFLGAMAPNHMFVDPSVHLNPNPIQDISGANPFAYYRPVLDQYGNEGQNGNNNTESLSLSLSSHHHRYDSFGNSKVGEEYVVGCNNGGSGSGSGSGPGSTLSKSAVPLGPFTGYASVLKGSRFLRPAQQLLEELCVSDYADRDGGDSTLLDPPSLSCVDDSVNCGDGGEQTRKKSRLLSLLDEVYKRYKQYYQQMQAAVAAFESVAGLSNAAPFANLAMKAMSKHFRCLKNAITDQLQFTSKSHGKLNCDQRDENQRPENSGRAAYGQRPFHAGFVDQPVWRPQRGLPERAVTVLRAWLFDHFLHPYPTDTDKIMLAKQTGLSRNQVSNWFINARVRLWKPMVEEIHMLETCQGQKPSSQRDDQQQQQQQPQPPNTLNNHLPTSCSIESQNASTSMQRMGDFPLKRTREDPSENPVQMKLSYDNLLRNNPLLGVGLSNAGNGSGGNGGVSLTLGLHQNGVGLSDSYPINAARRFGLDSQGGQEFVVSGFPVQNRQYGRDIIDGQIMHDFVG